MSNSLAGSLIGTGGKAIKELMTETEARVLVSSVNETYPGTSDRVVLITGTKVAVSLAQTLIWEMIAINSSSKNNDEERATWAPKDVLGNLGEHAGVEVSGKVSIPATAGGLILGKGGSNIRLMAEESGAKISLSNKDEALFTQERILTISGTAEDCIKCIDMVINKLGEEPEVPQFVYRGTTYNAVAQGMAFGGVGNPYGVFNGMGGRGGGRRGGNQATSTHTVMTGGEVSADTTITLAIPNELIGNIFGKNGSTLREIISLSGAKVTVSPRDEFIEGTTNRTVTITGNPVCAQTAHMFIAQRLQNPTTTAPRRKGREDDN